jgi:phage shock protein B
MLEVTGFVLGILLLTVVVPRWIRLHYETKLQTARAMSADEERTVADLQALATRLETRVQSLERILDAEVPNWRARS